MPTIAPNLLLRQNDEEVDWIALSTERIGNAYSDDDGVYKEGLVNVPDAR